MVDFIREIRAFQGIICAPPPCAASAISTILADTFSSYLILCFVYIECHPGCESFEKEGMKWILCLLYIFPKRKPFGALYKDRLKEWRKECTSVMTCETNR